MCSGVQPVCDALKRFSSIFARSVSFMSISPATPAVFITSRRMAMADTAFDLLPDGIDATGAINAIDDSALPDSVPVPPRIAAALQAMRDGRPVVLQDDHDREDEADLIVAAQRITVETMAFLIRECSGIVCLCLTDEKASALDLPPMVAHNESRHRTAFTVSIEARDGVSTGVSAADRVTTIRAAIAPHAKPADIVRPGHVFPLRAAFGGVLKRRGHTEGTVDLAAMAGLLPAGVRCELMNADGTMMRGAQVSQFAAQHGLPMLTIAELAAFREALR
jgi:3,4-dihydroxy 2-butanone 4-phosphate synthase